jgi:hypothetical protein
MMIMFGGSLLKQIDETCSTSNTMTGDVIGVQRTKTLTGNLGVLGTGTIHLLIENDLNVMCHPFRLQGIMDGRPAKSAGAGEHSLQIHLSVLSMYRNDPSVLV